MLNECDENGKALVDDLVDYFIDFYENRKKKGLAVEKKKCLYNYEIIDRKKVKNNTFSNPFKRFKDIKFMERCCDIEYVMFNKHILKKLTEDEKIAIGNKCDEKLSEYYGDK